MKNILLLVITMTLLSCGASQTVRDSKKVIKGEWVLNTISYSEEGTFNVSLLNDATAECFVGSAWKFIPNNNSGIYTIDNSECSAGARNFIFTIQEVDAQTGLYDFLLKPTDVKGKSLTNTGFRLSLAALTDTTMQWQQTLSVDGEPFTIFMDFSKIITN